MTTAYTSLLGLALPVTGELSGTWGDTVNTAITSLLDTAVAGTTSITTDSDITLTTTTGASNQARQAIILWNPASGTVTRNITAPAQSKLYTVINASGGTQSIVIRGVGPTTGVTIAKGESATVAWNGSDFVKVGSSGGAITFTDLTVTGNTILGNADTDTLEVYATSTFLAPVSFQGQVKLPSAGRSAAAALTVTNPAFLYGVASTYVDSASSGTIAAMAPFYSIARPTLSTSNVTTYTNAATVYIANAPAAGGSATITNPYALYIAAGDMYLGGSLRSNLTFSADATYDIGASGATRPRNYYGSGTATFGSNVGIGIAPVTAAGHISLSLDGTSAGAGGLINIYRNGTASGYIRGNGNDGTGNNLVIGSTTGNGIQFCVNGTTTQVGAWNSNGYLTIGTGAAGAPLSFTDATGLKIQLNADAANYYAISKTAATIAGDGQFTFTSGQSSAGEFAWNSGGSTRMLLGSTGNWLLGTTSNPDGYRAIITGTSLAKPLQVRGNFAASLSESQFGNDGTGVGIGQYGSAYSGGSNFGVGASGSFVTGTSAAPLAVGTLLSQPLYLGTGNTPVQVIDANGRTQFGATSLPSGITSYLMLYRSANNTTDGTMTIYNPSTGGSAVAGYYLGNATGVNLGGVSLVGSGFTESGQYRRNDTYVFNNNNNITIHAEASGKAIYQSINNSTITTANSSGFGIGVTPTVRFQVAGTAANTVAFIKYDVTSNNDTFNWVDTAFASNMTAGTNLISFIGQSGAVKNGAYFGFKYAGAGSNNNLLTMGLFAVDNVLNINGHGNVSLYNATTTADGVGITFPSTVAASSNANCLDDYEEGTWTPTVTGSSTAPTVSYSTQYGAYRKIGNLCWVTWGIRINTISGGSGEVQIEGLPFTSVNVGGYSEPMVVMASGVWTDAALSGDAYSFVWNSSTFMRTRRNNNVDAAIAIGEVQAGTYMLGQLWYTTA